MPQIFQAVCCYDCQTFQVQQVKKNPKWACKMCAAKQSIKKVYGRGSGADCRKLVQSLNMHKMTLATPIDTDEPPNEFEPTWIEPTTELPLASSSEPASSKWNQFLEEDDTDSLNVGSKNDDLRFTTDRDVMLREEKESRKFKSQKWKAEKRNKNCKFKPYQVRDQEKHNYSKTFNSNNKNSSFGAKQEFNHQHVSADTSLTSVLPSQEAIAKQEELFDSYQTDANNHNKIIQKRNIDSSNKNMSQKINIFSISSNNNLSVSQKHSMNNTPKATSSKWSQFMDTNQSNFGNVSDSSDNDDDGSDEGVTNTAEALGLNKMVTESVYSNPNTRSDKENYVTKNQNFDVNINIDEVFEDWY
ncbi:uncharacterized protein [Antedon mediterranea]|uniref:uncharacterized protein n=1 Tax=Antedon mediterranea TaxID=105859 RepID=UPI003AF4158D